MEPKASESSHSQETRAVSTALRSSPRTLSLGLDALCERLALKALGTVRDGEILLRLADGRAYRRGDPANGKSVTVTVESRSAFRRLLCRPRLGLGEAYTTGEWHADDLAGLFEIVVRTLERHRLRSRVARLERYRPHLPPFNGLRRAQRQIAYHYDLGNDLYELFLDQSLTYSCAYWERPGETLHEAQQNKYRRLCDKLALGPEDRVLEIGCGWGGFALHAAGERGAQVTALTISKEQAQLARQRVKQAGLVSLVEIHETDYRLAEGTFTKIVSIEMLEAIGQREYRRFFRTCDRLLAPGGLACVQTIAIPDQRYARYCRHDDWIRRYIFPGSLLPSLEALTRAMTSSSQLVIHSLEDIGVHYAETLRQWRERFLANAEHVRALGYDERFLRTWEFYLAFCEAAFRTRSLRDLQLVLTRPLNDRLPLYPTVRATF